MGHSSKKSNQNLSVNQGLDMNVLGQLMQNIDLSAMANMINNVDMNQVMSMFSGFGTQPSNQSANISEEKNETIADVDIPSPDSLRLAETINPAVESNNPKPSSDDPVVIVLNSIKSFLPPEKSKIIDYMITLLGIKVVIDSVFPARAGK